MMAKYEWHENGMCCAHGSVCSMCGKPVKGGHYWIPRAGKSCYYHEGTCITASRLGAKDSYGEYVKQQKLDANGY